MLCDQRDGSGGTALHAAVSRGSEPQDGVDAFVPPMVTVEDLNWRLFCRCMLGPRGGTQSSKRVVCLLPKVKFCKTWMDRMISKRPRKCSTIRWLR